MSDDENFDINPEDFENQESISAIADLGLTVYRAVKRKGASESEAFTIVSAFFAGMSKAAQEEIGS